MKTLQLKFKTLLVLPLMGIFLFSNMLSFAQNPEGKWIPPGHKGTVMQFTNDSLIIYNFDKPMIAKAYQVNDNDITIGTEDVLVLHFVTPNRLRAKEDRSNGSKDIIRLTPTKTKLTSAEIKKIEYFLPNDKNRSFRFNKPIEGSKTTYKLEKIDSTYFISGYENGKRSGALSIETLTPEKIVVYFSPEKSETYLGKNADGNIAQTNDVSSSIGDLTTAEAIIGKWFYKRIEGRPPLSDCTKKTFLQFTEDLNLHTKPYAENHSNGNCIEGDSLYETYEVIDDDQIEVTQNGKTETWKIKLLTKTEFVVERDGRALVLAKE